MEVIAQSCRTYWCESHKRSCEKHGCGNRGGILLPCRVVKVDWIRGLAGDDIDIGLREDGVVIWRKI
jgi:hypothetical protein